MATARSYREGWLTSMKIDSLRDDSAELFLFRLGLKADKNGVYHAEPELLRTAVYPLQVPRRRLADVTRFRDKCVRAGLLRYWTAADGRPYVQIIKFDQKTPNERPVHPVPPGDPDENGQEHFDLPEPPPDRMKVKRREVSVRSAAAAPHTQDAFGFVPEIQARWPRHDVPACLRAALRHVQKQRGPDAVVTVGWLEQHWMPKAAERRHGTGDTRQELIQEEPEGWQEWISERYPNWVGIDKEGVVRGRFKDLPPEIRKECRDARGVPA